MFGDHFGVGAGWNQFTTRIEPMAPSFQGAMAWRYGGPMIFLTGSL